MVAKAWLFVLCCAADAFVVRAMWTGRQIAEGQIRRGYFERFDGEVGLAVDNAIRPAFPSLILTASGELGVPPGVSVIAPLEPGVDFKLAVDSKLAPYVAIGVEAPLPPSAPPSETFPGEARMVGGRTLALSDGSLALVAWDPVLPWRDDAARLSGLSEACAAGEGAPTLTVKVANGQLEVHYGRCALTEPISGAGAPLLAALAGPDWVTVTRQPGWLGEEWTIWPVLLAIVAKMAAIWWGLGLASAVALAAVLLGGAFITPVAATLTWPLTVALGLAAAALRLLLIGLRSLRPRWRAPVALVLVALVAGAVALRLTGAEPRLPPMILHTHVENDRPDVCAVIGYSSAGGASLRGSDQQRGLRGMRSFLDLDCARCRDATGALAGSGETLGWMPEAYCASPASFGADGQVVFFGGANDDFLWGVTTVARLFIVSQQGIESWRSSQAPAAAASLAHIDEQVAAIDVLMRCIQARRAGFLFLHDFLVTDLPAGRESDRATMLARRRAAVEAAGGRFVDLLDIFRTEAGVSWFNDYVHPSLIAHERIAALACRLFP